MTKWISVKNQLPDKHKDVLVYYAGLYNRLTLAFYQFNKFYDLMYRDAGDITEYVTHWIELPDPPKEEKREYHPI